MRFPSCCVFLAVAVAAALGLPSCEGEGGGAAGDVVRQQRTRTGVVTLGAEEGLVFATGEVLTGDAASTLNADLMAFHHSGGLKLEAGNPNGAMRLERTPGGVARECVSLSDVSSAAPDPALHDVLFKPEPGDGAAVLGNVTDGHARIRVTDLPFGAAPKVTLEYEAWWYE